MMKITSESDDRTITVKLEGTLTRDWVKELLLYWQESFIYEKKRHQRIDLRSVTFIDNEGKALLALLYQNGVELIADNLLTKAIVEEISTKLDKE